MTKCLMQSVGCQNDCFRKAAEPHTQKSVSTCVFQKSYIQRQDKISARNLRVFDQIQKMQGKVNALDNLSSPKAKMFDTNCREPNEMSDMNGRDSN